MKRLLVVAVLLASGCGSSGPSALERDAAAMAAAARAGDGAALSRAYAQLRRDVAAGRSDGSLDAEKAGRVLSAAATLAADVPAPVARPTATPSPSARPVVQQPQPREREREHKKHKGKGEKDD